MNKVGKTVAWSVIGIVIFIFFFAAGFRLWLTMFYGDTLILQWQLRSVIHNPVAIKSVSVDKSTMEFLEHLPKNVRITSIQEYLDHNNTVQYFSAEINGRYVDMYVYDGLFSLYSVSKISVDGLPRLPEFYMD